MCGIFIAILKKFLTLRMIENYINKIKHRGPDSTHILEIDNIILGFHRLGIIDPTPISDQPLVHDNNYLICNGEIYNYKQLQEEYNLKCKTGSDCEVILSLYEHLLSNNRDLEENKIVSNLCKKLDAEFAYILYDSKKKRVYVARDPFGVRPLFYGENEYGIYFASEAKALTFCKIVKPYLPGQYSILDTSMNQIITTTAYYTFPIYKPISNKQEIYASLRYLFRKAVEKRIMSDRPIGCLLSGGLDSSLVTAYVCQFVNNLICFSTGLENSVDVTAAKKVVHFLKQKYPEKTITHHIIPFTTKDGFDDIPKVIYHTESPDVTTNRASTPQLRMAKEISEKTDIKVLYSGEGSDELFCGYQYSKLAPTASALGNDKTRLISELYLYDNLRTDRTMASSGLEVRVPFLDIEFVNFALQIAEHLNMCDKEIEKKILRDAFKDENILPDEILYRKKEAFSDAVSSKEISWYKTVQKKIETIISDEEFTIESQKYNINIRPKTKEALYYRRIYDLYYGNISELIPKYWMPQWTQTDDPSATVLACHSGDL